MKRMLVSLVVILSLLCVGCGRSMNINGTHRTPVGLISMNCQNLGTYSKKVRYEPCWGNIFWGTVFFETIIAPIYFFGFSMFNPAGVQDTTNN
jgi:hypothetical protein